MNTPPTSPVEVERHQERIVESVPFSLEDEESIAKALRNYHLACARGLREHVLSEKAAPTEKDQQEYDEVLALWQQANDDDLLELTREYASDLTSIFGGTV